MSKYAEIIISFKHKGLQYNYVKRTNLESEIIIDGQQKSDTF